MIINIFNTLFWIKDNENNNLPVIDADLWD